MATTATEPLACSISDAGVITGLSRPTIYRLIERGQLRTLKVGTRRLVLRSSIDELLAATMPITTNYQRH